MDLYNRRKPKIRVRKRNQLIRSAFLLFLSTVGILSPEVSYAWPYNYSTPYVYTYPVPYVAAPSAYFYGGYNSYNSLSSPYSDYSSSYYSSSSSSSSRSSLKDKLKRKFGKKEDNERVKKDDRKFVFSDSSEMSTAVKHASKFNWLSNFTNNKIRPCSDCSIPERRYVYRDELAQSQTQQSKIQPQSKKINSNGQESIYKYRTDNSADNSNDSNISSSSNKNYNSSTAYKANRSANGSLDTQDDPYEKTIQYLTSLPEEHALDPLDAKYAEKNIKRGLVVLEEVKQGRVSARSQANLMRDVVALQWALFHLAVQKGQGYEQGSFVVEDPHNRIFNYLKRNPVAKQRSSSHLNLVKKKLQLEHYGIDVLGSNETGNMEWAPYVSGAQGVRKQAHVLPSRKSHILFGQIPADEQTGLKTNHVFIKMEDNGLTTPEGFFNHSLSYVDAVNRRIMAKVNAGKGTAKAPSTVNRRERVDQDIVLAYKKVLNIYIPLVPKNGVSQSMKDAPKIGLRTMVENVEKLGNKYPQHFRKVNASVTKFYELLVEKNYDHLDTRTGDEVVFSSAELSNL